VPGLIAKNHNTRFAAINSEIVNSLKTLNLERYPLNYYLFGTNLEPSKTRAGNGRFGEEWQKMKKRLKLPTEMQMYSLRDTGIYDMLKSGIDDLSVMQHADHSSLEMTTLYGNHYDPNLIKLISEKAPKF
jgi:integrase